MGCGLARAQPAEEDEPVSVSTDDTEALLYDECAQKKRQDSIGYKANEPSQLMRGIAYKQAAFKGKLKLALSGGSLTEMVMKPTPGEVYSPQERKDLERISAWLKELPLEPPSGTPRLSHPRLSSQRSSSVLGGGARGSLGLLEAAPIHGSTLGTPSSRLSSSVGRQTPHSTTHSGSCQMSPAVYTAERLTNEESLRRLEQSLSFGDLSRSQGITHSLSREALSMSRSRTGSSSASPCSSRRGQRSNQGQSVNASPSVRQLLHAHTCGSLPTVVRCLPHSSSQRKLPALAKTRSDIRDMRDTRDDLLSGLCRSEIMSGIAASTTGTEPLASRKVTPGKSDDGGPDWASLTRE